MTNSTQGKKKARRTVKTSKRTRTNKNQERTMSKSWGHVEINFLIQAFMFSVTKRV